MAKKTAGSDAGSGGDGSAVGGLPRGLDVGIHTAGATAGHGSMPERENEMAHSNLQVISNELTLRPGGAEQLSEGARRAADFLKALAHESRLMILCILSEGEKSVSQLEDMLSLRQPTVSQQLARLRAEGLVATRRSGKAIYYSLASEQARVVVGAVCNMFGDASAARA